MTENKHFVTEAKWQESREELIDRINNVESKHTINYGKLSEKIAEGNAYQKQSYEVQKDTNQQMKQLNETNGKQWDAIKEIKFVVKNHEEDIEEVKGSVKERQKNNTNITIALIGGGATVISAAFGLAKLLF
ncbi:hypothetical protein JRG48_03135 [Staphylococcus caprae]|uniref:hypothetical protein n=1 Tax=Staphylococcus caprae TaxID=29380 RepID=UPI0019CFBE26|nr:hypothetical protein [Staphylococcus caprae]MBN6825322.1 hypothetical protein [Staphylococcus caprae]